MSDGKPLVLSDPLPRTFDLMFTPEDLAELKSFARLVHHEETRMPDDMVDQHLPEADFVMGQTDLPRERLERAGKLKAVFNVEGNFRQNIDYDYCFRHGIHVLTVSPVFAHVVAEMALGMALAAARGIVSADRAFREGRELYEMEGNRDAALLQDSDVGLIGFGDLARAFLPLIAPFRCRVKVHDPWLPDHFLRSHGCQPATLDEVLSTSRFIFVFATVTAENQGFLGRREFNLIQKGSFFLLMSRAAVVDFDAFIEAVGAGRFFAATDVFPQEPVPADHPVRQVDGLILSAHRAGALDPVFKRMGQFIVGDMKLMLAGLPPVACKRAERETVVRMRSMSVEKQ